MKKLKLQINNEEIKNSIIQYFKNKEVEFTQGEDADLIALYDSEYAEPKTKAINLHMSLLPAFQTPEALKEAYLHGVKVSGITIHEVEQNNFYGRILAQYPVLIGNNAHFDEYQSEIIKLGAKIYPIVIDTILQDKVFDFSDLFSGRSCSGGCGNCNGCHK